MLETEAANNKHRDAEFLMPEPVTCAVDRCDTPTLSRTRLCDECRKGLDYALSNFRREWKLTPKSHAYRVLTRIPLDVLKAQQRRGLQLLLEWRAAHDAGIEAHPPTATAVNETKAQPPLPPEPLVEPPAPKLREGVDALASRVQALQRQLELGELALELRSEKSRADIGAQVVDVILGDLGESHVELYTHVAQEVIDLLCRLSVSLGARVMGAQDA